MSVVFSRHNCVSPRSRTRRNNPCPYLESEFALVSGPSLLNLRDGPLGLSRTNKMTKLFYIQTLDDNRSVQKEVPLTVCSFRPDTVSLLVRTSLRVSTLWFTSGLRDPQGLKSGTLSVDMKRGT